MNSAASAIWRRALLALVVFFVVLSCPLPAEAHLNSTGMGPFYDGLLHFLLSPEDLVPALALALLAGLRGKEYGRAALFVLPGSWMLGGLIGMTVTTVVNPALTAMSFLIVGGLVAGNARLSLRWLTILAALLGIFHGFLNGVGMGQPATVFVALLGLISGVFILVALVAAFVSQLHWPWARIAVRVTGSWIVASGLLMIGWAVRKV
jgi:hydrogenase/urease accessory protein HupE